MSTVKKSVRLVDNTIAVCNNLAQIGGEINWSRSINAMAEQFNLLITDNTPELTNDQWAAFYCALNGRIPHPDIEQELGMLHWHITESYQHDSQVREFLGSEEAVLELVEHIKQWTISQRLAVLYKVQVYWRQGQI